MNEIFDKFYEQIRTFAQCMLRVEFVCDDRSDDYCVHVFRFFKANFSRCQGFTFSF